MFRTGLILSLIATLAGCAGDAGAQGISSVDGERAGNPGKTALLEALEANRAKWRGTGITSYVVTMDQECFCPYGPSYGPNRITVEDGIITSVIYLGEERDGVSPGDELVGEEALQWTVEGLFDRLDSVFSAITPEVSVSASYDGTYGFPTAYSFDTPALIDEENSLRLYDFHPL